MSLTKYKHIGFSAATGSLLLIGLVLLLNGTLQVARADPGNLFVSPNGNGDCSQGSPCDLQTALGTASDSDTIYLAQGTYTGTGGAIITATKSITFLGGWDGAPGGAVVRDPDTYTTILNGENARRVVYINGAVAPVFQGLTLQRGNAAGLGGDPSMPTTDFGGAVYANSASPTITNCRIVSSSAGFGGGMALYYGSPVVANSEIVSNTASQDIGGGVIRGGGGGIFLYQSPATIAGNLVAHNVASGIDLTFDGGGGLYLDTSAATILSNTIQDNYGNPNGGGIYLWDSAATIRQNLIQDNNAGSNVGGGIVVGLSAANIEGNAIFRNGSPSIGGGVFVSGSPGFTMTNNILAENSAVGYAPALFIAEYQPLMGPGQPCQGTLLHNTFADNNSPSPWMIHVGGTSSSPYLTTVAFTNTLVDKPGGIYVDAAGIVTLDTTLWDPALLLQPGLTVSGTGIIVSSTNYYSTPLLARPSFHLAPCSPAIDRGTDAGVTADIDGDPRPIGVLPDIGADEARRWTFLPLAMRNHGP
ncbi:MAG: right-handed parallel beta-helix repeat-containing protein [Anaerolineae bacterium]|nr:right-handed parallel beta-helix repeat-containing protein [Anaerolineae bacterium]